MSQLATASVPVSEYIDLVVVDWSLYPHNKPELAKQILAACRDGPGFLYLKNHGLETQRTEMFKLCEDSFKTPQEDKEKIDMTKKGVYMGWKPLAGGNEFFNIPKFNEYDRIPLTPFLEARAGQIETFSRSCHTLCLDLLSIFAIALDFPTERYFDASHAYAQRGGDHVRLLRYPPMHTLPDLPLSWDNVRTRILAHSDFGSLTLLFNQHVAGLQILDQRTNMWKYAAPRNDGGIIVNVGDALQAFSAGVLKSSWHRVVAPPRELGQEAETRHSLVYFSRPLDETPLLPLSSQSAAIAAAEPTFVDPRVPVDSGALPPTFGVWMARRAMNIMKPETNQASHNWVAPDERKAKQAHL